jgi:anti-sigma regulatory factor (Ser/Thr protein kinase)
LLVIELAVDSVDALSVSADPKEVRRASSWLERICLERGVSAEPASRLDLCLNETLANIIAHGGPTARSSPIHLQIRLHRKPRANEAELSLSVSDTGVAFDPLAFQPKPSPQTLLEAEPGGLGLIMMRSNADGMSYHYSEGRNQLTFRVCWTETE